VALTVTSIEHSVAGNRRTSHGTLALDSSYPSGGYAVTPRMFSLGVIDPGGLTCSPTSGFSMAYDRSAGTIRVFQFGSREVPVGVDLSLVTGVGFDAVGI
jgi:hypothetical protein